MQIAIWTVLLSRTSEILLLSTVLSETQKWCFSRIHSLYILESNLSNGVIFRLIHKSSVLMSVSFLSGSLVFDYHK